ncbi:MAG TPA: hypothetical protein VIS06_09215 [Mycobacteriales bacterium]
MRPEIEACVLRQCGSGRYGSGQSGSGRERARPARTLSPTDVDLLFEPAPPKDPTRVWFTAFVVGCCLVLAGWIVLSAATLPVDYLTRQWRLAWIGFDLALLAGLAVTGWAAWRRRQIVAAAALVTATLLCCDAWFDVVLSWGGRDQWLALASALLVELPLAGLLLAAARRVLRTTIHAVWTVAGQQGREPGLSSVPLLRRQPDRSAPWPGRLLVDRQHARSGLAAHLTDDDGNGFH